jgi:rod shape-determining protein MreB and related proteins
MLAKQIGIDLGTVNTLIYIPKKGIVLNEPSLAVFQKGVVKPIAVGLEAKKMIGRTPVDLTVLAPLKDGVIANYKVAEAMLNSFINKVIGSFQFLKPDIILSVPAGISSSEKRAITEATLRIGAKNVYLVKEPLLAAIGAGIRINSPSGHMVVDVGGGTSEVAVISLGSIVTSSSIKVGGIKIDETIREYVRKKYNLEIGSQTAERIKIQISDSYKKDNSKQTHSNLTEKKTIIVSGQDSIEGLPGTIEIQESEIENCLKETLIEIAQAVKNVLQETPPELSADILEEGISLTGGGSMAKGLTEIIQRETGISCVLVDEPLFCVIKGIGQSLKNLNTYKKVLTHKNPTFNS